jgi:hypothetical protein
MDILKPAIAVILSAVSAGQLTNAAELKAETVSAWNAYVDAANSQMQQRAAGRLPFLWMDESQDRAARVRNGEVVIAPLVGRGAEGVPRGLIHDWIGAIFIPGATIDSLSAVVHDYDNYQHIYRPVVSSSKTLACSDSSQEFQMVWHRKALFVSAAIQGRYRTHDATLDARRGYSIAEAVEVREIEEYGHPGERLLAPDTGSGFIWRIRSVARYEERDGGVYLELEATALTRDIPASLAWMVKPVVNRLSINFVRPAVSTNRRPVRFRPTLPIWRRQTANKRVEAWHRLTLMVFFGASTRVVGRHTSVFRTRFLLARELLL